MTLAFKPCWTNENADRVLETEALGGSDAVFLATHSHIEGFRVQGSQATQLNQHTESELLRVLSNGDRRHAFCIVHGEPGSGKSHFIKWLSIQWPRTGRDVVLLIRRAEGSLEGTLNQLQEKLGNDYSDLFKDLRQTTKVSEAGRARSFMSRLADALDPDYFEAPPLDADWCREHQPASLLSIQSIRDRWQSPRRLLQLIEGGGDTGRNSESATFNLLDIRDLVLAGSGSVVGSGVRGGAERLWKRLMQEVDLLSGSLDEGWLAPDLEREQSARFPSSMKLIAALNSRRNEAVQGVMGISPAGLKKLFQSVRHKLNLSGKRLVLLLEDITSFQGVDDSLIDVLVDDKGTQASSSQDAICPIISVVGVTPKYYSDLQGNYRQRATHEVFLGEDTGGLQDVALLREKTKRERFIVKYLAAVRAGESQLKEWAQSANADDLQPPNVCSACAIKAKCFSTFGQIDGIGTFPFTPMAMDRFFQALKADDLGQTWRTPRGIIQAILGPSLRNTTSLSAGKYPSQHVFATSGLSDDSLPERVVSIGLSRRIDAKLLGDSDARERVSRLIAFWGSPKSEDTSQDGEDLAFAGVKKSIFEAFDLPWLGEDQAAKTIVEDEDLDEESAPIVLRPQGGDGEDQPIPERPNRPTGVTRPLSPPPIPAPKRTPKTSKSQLERLQEDLQRWARGERPAEGQVWNKLLAEIVLDLDLRRFGISPGMLNDCLNENRIKIAGSSAGSRDSFEVRREEWVVFGFESYLIQRLARFGSDNERERHLRRVSRFIRKIEHQVADYVLQRVPRLANGSVWKPVAGLAQLLFARAIIRGDIPVGSNLEDCLRAVLSDPPTSRGDQAVRSAQWKSFLDETRANDSVLRKRLRGIVNLEGDKSDKLSGMIDTSEILPAIDYMRSNCKFWPVPSTAFALSKDLEKVRELVADWDPQWITLFAYELKQVEGRAKEVNGYIGDDAIPTHFRRLDSVVNQTSELLPFVSPEKVGAWKQANKSVNDRLDQNAEQALHALLDEFEEEEWAGSATRFDRYCRMAALPVVDLETVRSALKDGHGLIAEFLEHAKDQIGGSENTPDAQILKTAADHLAEFSRIHAAFEGSAL